jgi:hypothetical protein
MQRFPLRRSDVCGKLLCKERKEFVFVQDEFCEEILAMERAALDRLGRGDPDGLLEPRRADGLEALRAMYAELQGTIFILSDEIVSPNLQRCGDIAVLTFQFNSRGSENEMHWNTTEVYRRTNAGWRIIHSHWSFTQPRLAA